MKIPARTRGTQPPLGTLKKAVERYRSSTDPNTTKKSTARKMLRCHTVTMTNVIRHVVTSITIITAIPAAINQHKLQINFQLACTASMTDFQIIGSSLGKEICIEVEIKVKAVP